MSLTPVEYCPTHKLWFKRDDLFQYAGVRGGKVRNCLSIIKASNQPLRGLVTGGSRSSPQVEIVGAIALKHRLPVHLHIPQGKLSNDLQQLRRHPLVTIYQHFPGFNHVLTSRAHQDALKSGFLEIPFGMETSKAIWPIAYQVANLPFRRIKRIVVPVGSGMTLCGILHGLNKYRAPKKLKVIGIVVGADPQERLDRYAPKNWSQRVTLIKSPYKYQKAVKSTICGIDLDPIYEAKVAPYLRPGDLLWIVGHRGIDFNHIFDD